MALLRGAFHPLPDAEVSVEIDPRTLSRERLPNLRALGLLPISADLIDGYAQLPQRRIDERAPPDATERVASQRAAMLRAALAGFIGPSQVCIGMVHVALPGDALAQGEFAVARGLALM
jgi:hypothetical protein